MAFRPGGIPLAGYVRPSHESDVYGTHDSQYGIGGHRELEDILDRDGIPHERRREGMMVYVIDSKTTYQLIGGTDNTYWQIAQINTASSGSGSGGGSGSSGGAFFFSLLFGS